MATILTFTPLQPPTRTSARGDGRVVLHHCVDVAGHHHQQRLPLGSIRGITYLDALCLYCGAHLVWVDDEPAATTPPTQRANT